MKLFTMFSTEKRAVEANADRDPARSPRPQSGSRDVRNGACGSRGAAGQAVTRKSASVDGPGLGRRFSRRQETGAGQREGPTRSRPSVPLAALRSSAAIARDVRRRSDIPEGAAAPPLIDAAFLVPASAASRFKAAAKRLAAGGAAAGAE